VLFPFEILPEADFHRYGPNVRAYCGQIAKVLADPCLGQRLRQPPDAPLTDYRWDDFCKFDLPRRLRLIYVWNEEAGFVTIVKFGPHLGHDELDDVYDGLARMFELPPDDGHAQQMAEQCCSDTSSAERATSLEVGTEQIRRMARR